MKLSEEESSPKAKRVIPFLFRLIFGVLTLFDYSLVPVAPGSLFPLRIMRKVLVARDVVSSPSLKLVLVGLLKSYVSSADLITDIFVLSI